MGVGRQWHDGSVCQNTCRASLTNEFNPQKEHTYKRPGAHTHMQSQYSCGEMEGRDRIACMLTGLHSLEGTDCGDERPCRGCWQGGLADKDTCHLLTCLPVDLSSVSRTPRAKTGHCHQLSYQNQGESRQPRLENCPPIHVHD